MDKMKLSEAEREELMAMQRNRTMAVGQVRRARLILLPELPEVCSPTPKTSRKNSCATSVSTTSEPLH